MSNRILINNCDNCDKLFQNNSNNNNNTDDNDEYEFNNINNDIENIDNNNYNKISYQNSTKNNKIINKLKSYNKKKINLINKLIKQNENNNNNNDIKKDEIYATTSHQNQNEKNIQDLVKAEEFDKKLCDSSYVNRMRLAFNLLVSLANGLQNLIRLRGFQGDRIWKAAYAYAANTISMGLSSVQVTNRIEPILKIIKFKKPKCINESHHTSIIINTPKIIVPDILETAEECVKLNILAEPPENEPIRADIILIHGLHGSLANTWKQGLWSKERNPVDFERPPPPPIRPPKRPRHSRSNIFIPAHTNKKCKLETDNTTDDNNDDIDFIFESEEGSPTKSNKNNRFNTFRLRIDSYDNNSIRSSSSTSSTPCTSPTPEFNHNHHPLSSSSSPTREHHSIQTSSSSYSPCWPGEWLPLDCPGVRVIAINYTTDPYLWRPIWRKKYHRSTMKERVRVMIKMLIEKKVGVNKPIVWVGHSKGGLFIKQIIVNAWDSGKPEELPLFQSSKGVFFYSVPHRGSMLADISLPLIRRSIELVEIEKNSKVLLDLHRRFVGLYYGGHLKVEVFSFVETAMTFMQVLYLRIVGVDSADPGIGDVCGLQLDHREICKPRSRNCILYTELVKMINKVS